MLNYLPDQLNSNILTIRYHTIHNKDHFVTQDMPSYTVVTSNPFVIIS